MKKTILRTKLITLSAALLLLACQNNKHRIDTSDINVNLQFYRFEKDLSLLNTSRIQQETDSLVEQHRDFLEIWASQIVPLNGIQDKNFALELRGFMEHPSTIDILRNVDSLYGDFSNTQESLTSAFKHFAYYFPNKPLPTITTCITALNYGSFTIGANIGIGLDMYLGANYKGYDMTGKQQYMRRKMVPWRLVPDCMATWHQYLWPANKAHTTTLLDHIIYQGKVQYFIDAMMPETHDSIKFGFSGKDLTWCQQNSKEMWTYLVEHKHLFETNRMLITKYISDAPFTSNFPKESPGRAAVWLGREIIVQYMEKHPEKSLQDLLGITDAQELLTQSRFKP